MLDLILVIIDEVGKLVVEVIQLINQVGDCEGCSYNFEIYDVIIFQGFK